tara:strand:- start:718 stop:825 length:108 start_codon:yes stop_codon:yes gene_type:complete
MIKYGVQLVKNDRVREYVEVSNEVYEQVMELIQGN